MCAQSSQFSFFPDVVYTDPYSCYTIRRGIRWDSAPRQPLRVGHVAEASADEWSDPAGDGPHPPFPDDLSFSTSSSSSRSQSSAYPRSVSHAPSSSAEGGSIASSTSSAGTSGELSDRQVSGAPDEAGEGAGWPVLVKCIRPRPPLSPLSVPYSVLHLRQERHFLHRVPSLSPVQLIGGDHSLDCPPEGAVALVWTDDGGQPLTEVWALASRLSVELEPSAGPAIDARDPSPSSPSSPSLASPPLRPHPPPCSLLDFLSFSLALCERLHELHQQRLVFNFLHPPVLLYREAGDTPSVTFLDFTHVTRCKKGSRVPPPPLPLSYLPYVAPEAFDASIGHPCVSTDVRTDLYALGVVLYELCTGQPPFSSASNSLWRMRHWHRAQTPRRVTFPLAWAESSTLR